MHQGDDKATTSHIAPYLRFLTSSVTLPGHASPCTRSAGNAPGCAAESSTRTANVLWAGCRQQVGISDRAHSYAPCQFLILHHSAGAGSWARCSWAGCKAPDDAHALLDRQRGALTCAPRAWSQSASYLSAAGKAALRARPRHLMRASSRAMRPLRLNSQHASHAARGKNHTRCHPMQLLGTAEHEAEASTARAVKSKRRAASSHPDMATRRPHVRSAARSPAPYVDCVQLSRH